ncbi:NUDIX hydrolase [Anatilimnocola floriformis]|uniref:NUDIX hydrolase n=1 Tax=Anatilimnocola floriformis TaxID=2948575 RepID=UPI0020C49832|nr:NUDIX domain-containing protein [Anatilimnocola floriformis]
MKFIRAKVVCILRNADRLLLIRATDPHDGRSFLIPPGGGVEFGETLEHAVRREIFEEVGIELSQVTRLAMSENIFQFAGRPEHELVFVYEAQCHDAVVCAQDEMVIRESNGETLPARWYTLTEVIGSGLPLFPDGLAELLSGE